MARYTGPSCRLCRREGSELFLKGERCYTDKCAIKRRSYPPGQHGQGRIKVSDYGVQLREKQKVRRIYGILEKRLDNVAYRLGFATSRTEARQLVRHGHFTLNGRKVNIPSIQAKAGDVLQLREKSRKIASVTESLEGVVRRGIPQWLELDKDAWKGVVKAMPVREDITMPIQEQLIVELYSK